MAKYKQRKPTGVDALVAMFAERLACKVRLERVQEDNKYLGIIITKGYNLTFSQGGRSFTYKAKHANELKRVVSALSDLLTQDLLRLKEPPQPELELNDPVGEL